MKSLGELQSIAKEIQTQCRRKQPQLDKLCEELIRKGSGVQTDSDLVEQLLDLLLNTRNKKLMLLGLRIVESATTPIIKVRQPIKKIDDACLLSYFDGLVRADDEELQLRIVQVIPKLLAGRQLTAVLLQKFYGYCSKLKGSFPTRSITEACRQCLARLFQEYFSEPKEDYKQVLTHLANQLEPKPMDSRTDRLFKHMVSQLLLKVEGLNRRDFLERLIENLASSMPAKDEQVSEVLAAIEIIGRRPELRNLSKLFEKILKSLDCNEEFPTQLLKSIQRHWFKGFNMLCTLYRCDRETMELPVRIFECIEKRMLEISNKVASTRPDKFVAAVYELLATIRRELFLYAEVQPLLEAKVLKPAPEESLEQLKLNFISYFLHIFGPKLSRLLGLVCKWSDYQLFKTAVQEIEEWVVLSGLFKFKTPAIEFMKALAYACLPRKDGCTLTDKNLRALQALLELLHRKVYLMEVDSLTLMLKVVQALEKYFIVDGQTVTREEVSNFTEIEEEVLQEYRVVREVFRNLFESSQDLTAKLVETFLQALTQVAFDTLTKASYPQAQQPNFGQNLKENYESTFEEKTFALNKVCILAIRNIHRIEQFWSILSSFMLIHIAHRDLKLALQGVEVLFHVLLELARLECEGQQSNFRLVFNTVLEVVRSCQQERVHYAVLEGLIKIMQNHQQHIQSNIPLITSILEIVASHCNSNRTVAHLVETCLELCVKEFEWQNCTGNAGRTLAVLNLLVGKDSESRKGMRPWKIIGGLIHQLCSMLKAKHSDSQSEQRQIVSDGEATHRLQFTSLKRSPSLKDLSTQIQGFAECIQSIMELFVRLFRECSTNDSEHYLQVLTWTLTRQLHSLPIAAIIKAIVPSTNKLLMFLVDRSTAGVPHETPNFNTGRKNIHEREQQHWQYLTSTFAVDVFQKVVELVGCMSRPARGKITKSAAAILKTLVFTINTCLFKRSVKSLHQLLPLLQLSLQELPEVVINYESLLTNTTKFLEFIGDEGTAFGADELKLLGQLQIFISCLKELTKRGPIKDQVEILETIQRLLNVLAAHNIEPVLREELMRAIGKSSPEAIRTFLGTISIRPTTTKNILVIELEKVQFRQKVCDRIRSSQSIESTVSSSSIAYEEDPQQLYSILLSARPSMPGGLINFLRQAVGVTLDSADQQEEFVLKVLPQLLTADHRKESYCIEQFKYITALLMETLNIGKVVEAVSRLCKVHQKVELFELLTQLSKKGLILRLREQSRKEVAFNDIKRIVGALGQSIIGPQFNEELPHANSHIAKNYGQLLECFRLNDLQLTELTIDVLKRLAPYAQQLD